VSQTAGLDFPLQRGTETRDLDVGLKQGTETWDWNVGVDRTDYALFRLPFLSVYSA